MNAFFEIVSAALHNQMISDIGPSAWTEIYNELQAHSIQILPADIVNRIGLPAETKKAYTQAVGVNLQYFYTVLEEQAEVLSYLSESAIPSVILKGASAAVNYPRPEYRCMGDIDVLVPLDKFEDAYNVLNEHYRANDMFQGAQRHISFESESGVEIELHQFFSTSGNARQDKNLDEMLYKAFPYRVYADFNGYAFPMLPPLENGIVLLCHINQHLSSGLGLRQIIDWMCFVEKYLDDEMWERFAPAAEQVGMVKLAVITTAMCQKYLGLSSALRWCQDDEDNDALCDELMDYILAHGNFGRKAGRINTTTVSIIRWFRNPIIGVKMAQKYGLQTWDAYRKHRWLKPFAWIYQLFRWAKHGVTRGVSLDDILRNREVERGETDLLERLGVTRR